MYVRYQRPGRQIGEQVSEITLIDKRQTSNGLPVVGGDADADADGFSLTGPITITITRQTRLPLPTPTIESISLTQISFSTAGTISESAQTILPASTSPPALTTTISSLTSPPVTSPSRTPTSFTASPTPTNTNGGTALQNNAATSSAITGGAVAGIVISAVFVVGTVLFFVWRARSRKRRRKNRGIWTTSTTLNMPAPVSNKDYTNEKGQYEFGVPTTTHRSTTSPIRQSPKRVPVPRMNPKERPTSNAFDSGFTSPFVSTFGSATFLSGAPPYSENPLQTQPPQILSPFSAKVISTFIPNLPDELKIELDGVIRVLAEYDDGWALCMNAAGEQGMVPLECLDRGDSGVSLTRRSTVASGSSAPVSLAYLSIPEMPSMERRGSKRLSSLDPTAQPLKTYPSS